MVVIRQVGVVRVVVRVMRRVVGVPGGSGVVVPVGSIAWPAERWSVVLRVMVVGVWWLAGGLVCRLAGYEDEHHPPGNFAFCI